MAQGGFQVRLFRRKGQAVKNWRARALLIDPKKTKLILVGSKKTKDVPAWAYRKFVAKSARKL